MNKKIITDIDVAGKKVLMRVDFNVPITADGTVGDDTRIQAALPTIHYVLEQGGSLILMSHLGRPKGQAKPEFSLAPVAEALSVKLGIPVGFADNCVGEEAAVKAACLEAGQVLLLENLRFHPEEEGKGVEPEAQEAFAAKLASLGEVYINDAFGTAHRAHASMAVVTKSFEDCAAGFLLEREINYLAKTLEAPEKPFVAIIGGAKISGKIDVVENLLGKVDALLIGGGMAYTFYRAMGLNIGDSLVEEDKVELAKETLAKAEASGVKFLLPLDTVVAQQFPTDDSGVTSKVVARDAIEDGWMGLDIGPETVKLFAETISSAKTVIWNGPMGVFERKQFAVGTQAVAQAIADADCTSIIGGGDSVSAIKKLGFADQVTHLSTGGGASLELMEGKVLPGLAALTDKA